jgi:hypothetical protein
MNFHPLQIADNYFTYHESPVDERTIGRMRPSDASIETQDEHGSIVYGTCIRQSWYRYTKAPVSDPYSASHIRKLRMGEMVEENERYALSRSQVVWEHNYKVSREYQGLTVAGELDLVFNTDPPVIGEIKSGWSSHFYKSVLGPEGSPNEAHILQGMLYLWLFPAAKDLVYIYLDRGSMQRREHWMSLDRGVPVVNGDKKSHIILSKILTRYAKLHEYIEKGVLPPADFEQRYSRQSLTCHIARGTIPGKAKAAWQKGKAVGDWQCRECPFRSKCADEPGTLASHR